MTHKPTQRTTWVGNNRQFFLRTQGSPTISQHCFSFSCTKTICTMEKNSTLLSCTDRIQHDPHKIKLFQAGREWLEEVINSVYGQAAIVKYQHCCIVLCRPILKHRSWILWNPSFFTQLWFKMLCELPIWNMPPRVHRVWTFQNEK